MLVLLSPAKTLDETKDPYPRFTQADGMHKTQELLALLRLQSAEDLGQLMGISPKLAALNFQRYQHFSEQDAKQALLCFKGDSYKDIEVEHYNDADFEFAQTTLRILSGLYGVLRPLDLMRPYRLEMGTKLGKGLYQFWGDEITELLNQAIAKHGHDAVINLASQEYFAAVKPEQLQAHVITPVFKEKQGGNLKIIGLFAKRARGMMTNHIIRQRLEEPSALQTFKEDGYQYAPDLSDAQNWVFIR
jgi:cytoplasmic iron level regulating protein YaaA (DUF328/UPF0246 family)